MKQRTSFGQHTLPGEYFTSAEIFAEERDRIFGCHWLLAGLGTNVEGADPCTEA